MLKISQAAMEFLITYGWAILVILATASALAYFGVLIPERFLPEKCYIAPGIECVNSKIGPSQSTLILSNTLGWTITITNVAIGNCSSTYNENLLSGTERTYKITGCANGAIHGKFKANISITYIEKETGLTKTKYGSITTKIE